MATNSISPVTAGSTATETSGLRMPTKTLGQEDFLKLLVAQLSSQDPMNPQKDTEFIAQVAQFSSLEQTRAMQTELVGLRSDQQVQQAAGLIGRTVSLRADSGEVVTGQVTGLAMDGATPRIVVNGQPFSVSSLLSVSATPV